MRKSTRTKPKKKNTHPHYLMRLFMAGDGPNSQKALLNLRSLCKEHFNGNCTIETIDVVKDFQAAVRNNILITPALIMVTPGPQVTILGTLSDRQKVLSALRITTMSASEADS
jgi:circadian clock protein KaiB